MRVYEYANVQSILHNKVISNLHVNATHQYQCNMFGVPIWPERSSVNKREPIAKSAREDQEKNIFSVTLSFAKSKYSNS